MFGKSGCSWQMKEYVDCISVAGISLYFHFVFHFHLCFHYTILKPYVLICTFCMSCKILFAPYQIFPALVAQLNAHPTRDQEVAGSTWQGSATFFHGDLIMKYFLSLPPIQEGQLSVSGERMCMILVNRLED